MSRTQSVAEAATAWRQRIHAHPELGFEEEATSALVAELLGEFGFDVHSGIGGTGVVGVLRRGSSTAAIGLRADMDALPIEEAGTIPHKSTRAGAFHGCGHDGHTAMLLGAAKYLAADAHFDGTIYMIFQPCEETGLGAQAMINDGLFEQFPMDAVYGMHNMPGLPAGTISVRTGPMMSFEDNFQIEVAGVGGHASMPDKTIDPIVVAAEIVLALQTIVARSLSAIDTGVVSITEILTDGARNVIPSTVTIRGDCRGFTEHVQDKIETRMRTIVQGIALAHDAIATVNYSHEFVVLNNTPTETKAAVSAALAIVGSNALDADCPPAPCSEDFARMLAVKPGCYILIGNDDDSHTQPLHNPSYDFNDKITSTGIDYWIELVEQQLSSNPESLCSKSKVI